jgi:hypothetical protein
VPSASAGFCEAPSRLRSNDSSAQRQRMTRESSTPMTPTFIKTPGVCGSSFISLITPMIKMWYSITLTRSDFELIFELRAVRLGMCWLAQRRDWKWNFTPHRRHRVAEEATTRLQYWKAAKNLSWWSEVSCCGVEDVSDSMDDAEGLESDPP